MEIPMEKNITLILPESDRPENNESEITLSLVSDTQEKKEETITLSLAESLPDEKPEEITLEMPASLDEAESGPVLTLEPAYEKKKADSVILNLPYSAVDDDELDTLRKDSWRCIQCNTVNPNDYNFCTHCGSPRPVNPKANWTCTHCGTLNSPHAVYCRHCGRNREISRTD